MLKFTVCILAIRGCGVIPVVTALSGYKSHEICKYN